MKCFIWTEPSEPEFSGELSSVFEFQMTVLYAALPVVPPIGHGGAGA
jgi:hypothetical protein